MIPDRAKAHNIGADVTDADWLNNLPTDRPAVIVADGLMGFLTKDDFVSLLNLLIHHFPLTRWPSTAISALPSGRARSSVGTESVAGVLKFAGVDDPHELERWNPKLKLIKEILLAPESEVAEFRQQSGSTTGC